MSVISTNSVTLRLFTWDDLPAVFVVMNESAIADGDDQRPSEDQFRHMMHAPDIDPEHNFFVAVTPAGDVVGGGIGFLRPELGWAWGMGAVHPAYRRRGIGRQLVRATEARVLERAAETPDDRPIYIQRGTRDTQVGTVRLLESEGYAVVRYFYEMQIDLGATPEPPVFPDGITLRPFDPERDARAVYDAEMAIFADHWGFVGQPYENWAHNFLNEDRYDFSLWQIAVDGDAVAGIAINRQRDPEHPDLAWVDVLGVDRPWRKRGIGLALLRQSFAVFRERGFTGAGLGVDADSPTNAVALYERAGMHVRHRLVTYRKVLRGRAEDIQD